MTGSSIASSSLSDSDDGPEGDVSKVGNKEIKGGGRGDDEEGVVG